VRKGEPGESYVIELRKWPDKRAGIRDNELAERTGLRTNRVSELLQNGDRWKATQNLLEGALKIIEACGGQPDDLTAWTKYHYQVAAYQAATEKPPLPRPLTPARFATPQPASNVALATADPAGDRPRRPRRRWALLVATWAVVFGVLAWRIAYEPDWPVWEVLTKPVGSRSTCQVVM
jgi:hypothetical protein